MEVFKDPALPLPPLNTSLARRMMEQTRIYKALEGVRQTGGPRGTRTFAGAVQPPGGGAARIKEIDINPVATPNIRRRWTCASLCMARRSARSSFPNPRLGHIQTVTWRRGP